MPGLGKLDELDLSGIGPDWGATESAATGPQEKTRYSEAMGSPTSAFWVLEAQETCLVSHRKIVQHG